MGNKHKLNDEIQKLNDEIQKLVKNLEKLSEYISMIHIISPDAKFMKSFVVQITKLNKLLDNKLVNLNNR